MATRKLISFDWALKRLLRSKANFEVLEGFLSELLHDDIAILDVLESEANQETEQDKFNRVDLKARNKNDEIIIIEVQYDYEIDYLQRILYGTSKAITEHIKEAKSYITVAKVISVNIIYFNLGSGKDYVYHGTTNFLGLHKKDQLQLTKAQHIAFNKTEPCELFPEYYLIKVNQFDDVARDPLDEWIYLFKNEEIKDNFSARGLVKAKEILDVMKLSTAERKQYERHQDALRDQASFELTSYSVGREKGREEGLNKGKSLVLRRLIIRRFGTLPDWAKIRIDAATSDQLEVWIDAIFDVQNVDQLLK